MKPVRFAFGYKARSGKDEASYYLRKLLLCDNPDVSVEVIRFASPLYDILDFAQRRAGFPSQKDRIFLQWIGTDWGRAHDPNVWVKCLTRDLKPDVSYFVADVRFPSEVDGLLANDFKMVLVDRPDRPTSGNDAHVSESALDAWTGWDYVLRNHGDLHGFFNTLDLFYRTVVVDNSTDSAFRYAP
jgi:hypothetical protein